MTLTYQQQFVLDGLAGRAAILNLDARYNRAYSAGDLEEWIKTFRHAGATVVRGGETFTDLRAAFDGGGKRLITVDGVNATQRCVGLAFVGAELHASGTYTDELIYERGGWYFTSRSFEWDLVPRENALPV